MATTTPSATTAVRRTAAALATADVPVVAASLPVGQVVAALRARRHATVAAVALTEGGRFAGLVALEDLLAADDAVVVSTLAPESVPVAEPGEPQELVAWRAAVEGSGAVAVCEGDRLVGVVPAPRLLGVLLDEHREDMARLSGFLHDAQGARQASGEPVARRFWHRLPWLLVGLAGALISAVLMGGFEEALQANVVIAFFLPGIVYLADAVGTQTETLLVRGLSVGVPVRTVALRELATGALVGVTLATVFAPVGLWLWGDVRVVVAVSLSILGACGTATVVAMTLPALLQRLGTDPAFGSGPLATVVQDLLSILMYLAITTALLT